MPSLPTLRPGAAPKKRRKQVKLACVAVVALGVYVAFVYAVVVSFRKDLEANDGTNGNLDNSVDQSGFNVVGGTGTGWGGPPPSGSQQQTTQLEAEKKTEKKAEKKAGPAPPKPKERKGNKKKEDLSEASVEALLSGEMLLSQTNNGDNIKKQRKLPRAEALGNRDGMRDGRSAEDIVASVFMAAEFGDQFLNGVGDGGKGGEEGDSKTAIMDDMPILTAYCEPVNQTSWETKPLPRRDEKGDASSLLEIQYPRVKSCPRLTSQWPIDSPPTDLDPFLPWIHDVFPTADGSHVMFVAQNRRRCFNGQRILRNGEEAPKGAIPHKNRVLLEYGKSSFMRPQVALFQHVPVKRVGGTNGTSGEGEGVEEPRLRLSSHEEADADGVETRFLCRFKTYDPNAPPGQPKLRVIGHSLSVFELDYDYHTYRKGYKNTATAAGFDNHMIWMSQLLFKCPVPGEGLRTKIREGGTRFGGTSGDDGDHYTNLYVDLVPIRTPPRYTAPMDFFPPRYGFGNKKGEFQADVEWGKEHFLPTIHESGRWENIPICMPSLMTHGIVPVPDHGHDTSGTEVAMNSIVNYFTPEVAVTSGTGSNPAPQPLHGVIACTWASTTFKTRSNRADVNDGKRRLREWLEFNLLAGFDHIYVYDNSGAFTDDDSLADIVDQFPDGRVTRVDWPCRICSNRDGNEGERSSQYAAESSCRLRFGSHARWLGSFDTDEYLVPMGEFGSIDEVSRHLDKQNIKVAVFKSAPAKPRLDLLDDPKKTENNQGFLPVVKDDETFLHTYNCNWEPFPREHTKVHRSKQMYRADYVKLHYVHYSTVTTVSQMTEKETKEAKEFWQHRYKEKYVEIIDEEAVATMLHTKSKVEGDMSSWKSRCKQSKVTEGNCNAGFAYPKGTNATTPGLGKTKDGYAYNCYMNERIESDWAPKLLEAKKRTDSRLSQQ